MHSIRIKFTLTLLLTGFTAVALVGLIAQHLVLARFDQLALKRAFSHYQADVRAYLVEYGSWQQGEAAEGFLHFTRRRLSRQRGEPPSGVQGRRPPPGMGEPRPGLQGQRPPPRPLGMQGRRLPPFRFMLLDPNGRILQGNRAYPRGSELPARLRVAQMPITVNGRVRAYAVPMSRPNLSALDRSYLAAIDKALLYSLLVVSALTLLGGIFFGSRLSRSLRDLTAAVTAMENGNLRQRVAIQTRDEIGILSRAFNAMSKKLAKAYESLEDSHRTITEQAERLKELSIRDDLTGLYNRRHFNERVEQLLSHAKRHGRPLSIAIGDIDDFKQINDGFSHSVGDRVLETVAHLIKSHIREADIPARFGGEEFVIAFPETDSAQAVTLCERLRGQLEDYDWSAIAEGLKVTISIGVETDLCPANSDKMLVAADKKLYAAKDGGKNRLVA